MFTEFNVFLSQEKYNLDRRSCIYNIISFQNMELPPSRRDCLPYAGSPMQCTQVTGLD